nr:hypothetical protein [Tanacetum cinerariifolium]
MARLAFCDYHNMIAILKKSEHNVDFHQIVDFVEASHIRYALTINPTVYVSHIRQFWSTARIETTDEGTKILATIDGKPKTISESSIRRNLKLNDEEGISSLPDAELFENLALMGPKRTGFNEFSSNIATAVGEGSGTPTEPHHTPSPEAQQSPLHDFTSSLHPTATTKTIPTSTALPTAADEPASLLRDDSQGEAFPTVSGLEAGHDRENIIKTFALPHDSTPRVTSLTADEGTQELEIYSLKERIKLLEGRDKGSAELFGDDAPIKGRSLETGEEACIERSTEKGSNDTEELVNVLTSMDAANILTSGVQAVSVPPVGEVPTVSVPPVVEIPTVGIPTGSGLVPTASPIFTTASMVTPYSRRKGKEKMLKSDTPKKKKLQEQIDVQMAREIEEEMARDAQRMNEQIARDAETARIHAEKELQMMIDGLDRSNEMIAKHLHEYKQAAAELTIDMPLVEIREKFILVWKKIKDFMPMASKEEGERFKRKGLRLEQDSAKKIKTSEQVSEEDLKEMMQLVPVEEVYMEALQVKHPIIDWEIHTDGKRDYWKIIRLGGHTGRFFRNTMLKAFPLPVMKFPLPEYFPTASEEVFPLLSQRDAPAKEVCTAEKLRINRGQRHIYISQRRVSVIPGMCPIIVPMI